MLLFCKLVDETRMVKPLEPTIYHNSEKYLIPLPLRTIYFRSFHYETPCSIAIKLVHLLLTATRRKPAVRASRHTVRASWLVSQ